MNLELAPESLDALVEQVATLAAAKVRDELRPHWLNEDAAADYIGISKKALGNARRAGKVQAHEHGRTFVYATAELDRFVRGGG